MDETLAVVFALVTGMVVAFQVALALGAPWGAYAMGGAWTHAAAPAGGGPDPGCPAGGPGGDRAGCRGVVSVPLLEDWPWLIWLPVAVSAVAVLLNASTRSHGERRIWLPVGIVLLLSCWGGAA